MICLSKKISQSSYKPNTSHSKQNCNDFFIFHYKSFPSLSLELHFKCSFYLAHFTIIFLFSQYFFDRLTNFLTIIESILFTFSANCISASTIIIKGIFFQFQLNFPSMSFSSNFRMLISQQSSTTPVQPAESINTKMEVFFIRELRNTKIIAVDHGYGNMKTANTVTPTGIKAYETEPIFTGNILEYNGIYYRIGEGHKEFIPDKAMDEEYYLLTLMAIARELNVFSIREADVHLAAGLPLTWIRNQREAFRSYLLQNPEVHYRFNGKEYHLRFVGCSLYPQGYPAIVNHLGNFKGTNLLADIGNGTMNILYINNKKAQESRCWTEKLGVNQCMIAAKNAVLDKF